MFGQQIGRALGELAGEVLSSSDIGIPIGPDRVAAVLPANVAAFGAFVDIGVHQDGLVHISQMSRGFVANPHDIVRSGDIVRVRSNFVNGIKKFPVKISTR